ncbi:MAG: DUF452 family protein [Muribaculum sp.]|nr:DUF452 family protein [Muribaculum sp.]
MNIDFIRKCNHNSRLILILAGWSSDTRLYSDVTEAVPNGWDILCISGFDSPSIPPEIFSAYHTVYLYAWSLGVAASRLLPPDIPLTRSFAIAGTPLPVNDDFGIPTAIYEGTRNSLDSRRLTKFRRRMVCSADEFTELQSLLPDNPDIDDLKNQLDFIASIASSDAVHVKWHKAYIPLKDAIFPPDNQRNYWEKHSPIENIVEIDAPHYVSLAKIIKSTIHNPAKVGLRFMKAIETYIPAASPQKHIAQRLVNFIPKEFPSKLDNILEIGQGAGMLTRIWAERFNVNNADFIDLYSSGPFGVALNEVYHISDAEDWIANTHKTFDCIISANTMQWFANPVKFIKDAYGCLKTGGILLLSSFLPGNLRELDSLRPCPMAYKDLETIKTTVTEVSTDAMVAEEEIPVEFDSVKEALIHLKKTGVGVPSASTSNRLTLTDYAKALITPQGKYRLTYRPVYIIIRKDG